MTKLRYVHPQNLFPTNRTVFSILDLTNGTASVAAYYKKLVATGPIAYWRQNDKAAAAPPYPPAHDEIDSPAQDGAYTGVTLERPGIGDGYTCALFDGINDYTDIYSATFAAALNGAEGSLAIWLKAYNAGVWTDGLLRVFVLLRVDANNYIRLNKSVGNNQCDGIYRAGGVTKQRAIPTGGTLDYLLLLLTWSVSAGPTGEVRAYLNGAQVGAALTNLGAWAGALDVDRTLIGANDKTPLLVAYGDLGHCLVWDRPLTPAEAVDIWEIP